MSFCHECGEQVAKEDVFCPYCGISLNTAPPVEDLSMSETIVGFPPPVIEASPAASAPAETPIPPPPPPPSPFGAPVVAEIPVVAETPSAPEVAAEPEAVEIAPEPEVDAAVVESAIAGTEVAEVAPEPAWPTDEEIAVAAPVAVAEPVLETETPVVKPADAVVDAPVAESPLAELPIAEEPVAELPIAEEPVAEQPVAEAPAPAEVQAETFEPSDSAVLEQLFAAEGISDEPAPAVVADAPPVAETPVAAEAADVHPEIVDNVPTPVSEAVTAESPAYEEPADAAPVVAPIEMPAKPLILEDEPAPKFDSVQIIEKKVAEMSGDQKEARSYTTPNIGGTDTDGRKSAKLQPLEEGTVLNSRYEIVRKIGGGGMGAVYLANDRNLGGVLRAVKEMVQSYIESEQQDKAVNDFKRESLLLTSLDHPAIPTIYDYFFDEKEGRFYLVMRYISGGDLAGRLRAAPEGKIDEKSVTEWAIQIADVLEYLHKHEPPIVYRDLKPANVMIDGNSGRVMLIDFGIARWVNKEEKGVTAVGTMGYAPPELFSGNVEARSDIYSLGSTMFHLLTGADPQSNPLLIFDFQKNPRPRQINSLLSDQIEQILMRAVEYNADLRFRSAAEMRDALKDHLANLNAGRATFGVKAAPANRAFSEQPVFCGFCGKQIVATDVFCAFCGAQQPLAQQGGAPTPVAVQPLVAKLTIMATGDLEPSIFKIEKNDNLLGRRDPMSNIFPEVDLSKFDPQTKISRRHARVWRDGHGFLVEDLGSSNGTTLIAAVGEPIRLLPHQPHTLSSGDRLKLGDTLLHFTVG